MNPIDRSTLDEAAVALRAAQARIRTVTNERGKGWRLEVVQQRRILADKLGKLIGALQEWSPPPHAQEVHTALRKAFSELRAALAEHQARWPAVSLDPDAEEYRKSVEAVRAAHSKLDRAIAEFDDFF